MGFHIEYHDERPSRQWAHYFKPDLLITPAATEVHGITNEMVAGAPRFDQLAGNIASGFKNCDYCGYNVSFDLRCITANMRRAGVRWSRGTARLVDALAIWRKAAPRTLSDAMQVFLQRSATHAHRAFEDAKDAFDISQAQLAKWPDLPRTPAELHLLCFGDDSHFVDPDGKFIWSDNQVVCNFGKHGKTKMPLKYMPRKYLDWMLTGGDFSIEVQDLVTAALKGIYPTKDQPSAARLPSLFD